MGGQENEGVLTWYCTTQLRPFCSSTRRVPMILLTDTCRTPHPCQFHMLSSAVLWAMYFYMLSKKRCLILFGQFKCQKIFQISLIPVLSEQPLSSPLCPSIFSTFWATLYALLNVNLPFEIQAHMRESSGSIILNQKRN